MDVLIGNNGVNQIFQNHGGGVFTAVSGAFISGTSESMSVAWADLDNDGDMDALIGNNAAASGVLNEVYLFTHCSGAFARLGTSQACIDIPAHSRRGAYADQAFECAEHTTRFGVLTECAQCAPGFQRPLGELTCSKCSVGYAQSNGEGTSCIACDPGTYSNFNGCV